MPQTGTRSKLKSISWAFLVLGPLFLFLGFDQSTQPYIYPVDVFRSITGTFGEPRSNHFHSGMDIRIGGRIGTPIKAARSGYVYRINVSPSGFGKALYLRHPDGQYSVYAHLDGFAPKTERLVHRRQVENQQSEVQLFLRPEEIPVKKGEVIGYGGNSGSSRGPHLHFEIRDPQERIINPMAYFQEDLSDNIAPIIQEVMLTPLSPSSHIQGLYGPYRQSPRRRGLMYYLPEVVEVSGPVGLSYRAFDLLSGARFHCGINYVSLSLDEEPIYRLSLDRFAFSETRFLNHHIDYPIYKKEGKRFEKAFIDQGNRFSSYQRSGPQGVIELDDREVHMLKLELEDYHGNKSVLQLRIQQKIPNRIDPTQLTFSDQPHIHSEVYRNVLSLQVDCPSRDMLDGLTVTNVFGTDIILKPSYAKGDMLQFIYPLDSLLFPSAVVDHTDSLRCGFSFEHLIPAGKASTYMGEKLQLRFPAGAVYQDTYLEIFTSASLPHTSSEVFHIGEETVALHKYITLSLPLPDGPASRYAYIAYKDDEGEWSYQGNRTDKGDRIQARVREFGTYALKEDREAPQVYPRSFRNRQVMKRSPNSLRLTVKDEGSGINSKSIQVYLDEKWVPFYYDYKNDLIEYRLPKALPAGTHTLRVKANDEVGNLVSKDFQFETQ